MRPEIRYARNGEVSLAWTSVGTGPVDMLVVLGGLSHIEHLWDEPGLSRFFEKFAASRA